MARRAGLAMAAWALAAAAPLVAQPSYDREGTGEDARPRDIQRLQDDVQNLDEALQSLDPNDARTDEFRRRAEEIREDVTYLKVRLRRQQRSGRPGTGVGYDEVEEVRRAIADLHADIDNAYAQREDRGDAAQVRVAEGTEIVLRLEQRLSSATAQREDRVDASVFRPVRAEGMLAIPAGTRVRGVVRRAQPAERPNRAGELELDFDSIFIDRQRFDLRARVVSIMGEEEGRDTAEKAGIGAVLGGVVGGLLGGKKGALAGILIGGTGAVVATKGNDLELPPGTLVRIRLDRPLRVPPHRH